MVKMTGSRSLRSYQWAGFLLMLLLIAGLGGWAALASISGAVIAQARVVVETSPKKLLHLDGGIVAEIPMTDGDYVEAGQLVLRLDDTEVRASLEIIDNELVELIASRARLGAEREGAGEIDFPPEIIDRLDHPNVKMAYTGQKNLFQAKREAKAGEQEQLKSKIRQLEEEIVGLKAQQAAKESQFAFIERELTDMRSLETKGLVRQSRILALERERTRLRGERGFMIARTARTQGAISETRLRIIQIDKDIRTQIAAELRETQTKIAELKEKKLVMTNRLARTEIRAPRSGFVHQLGVHTIGGVIGAGEQIMVLVPKQDKLIFEAQVRPSDIDQVQMGSKAVIRLNAFDPGFTPELIGKVAVISPDSIMDPDTKTQYYLVRLNVANSELVKLGDRLLVLGMLAEAFIETASRTVLQYLSKPISDRIAHVFRER